MSTNRVILPEAFRQRLSAEHLKNLEDSGVTIDPLERLTNYDLKPAQVGEAIVGTLNDEEIEIFCRWKDATRAQMELGRRIEARQYRANADAVEKAIEQGVEAPNVTTAADIHGLLRLGETMMAYRDLLAMIVRERLDLWHFQVAFRSGGKIIRGPRRSSMGCDE